jgi:hypothetical protein
MLTQAEAQARVARGAEVLDRHRPGWYRRVNLGTLQLETCTMCVLGQLGLEEGKGFSNMCGVLLNAENAWGLSPGSTVQWGFASEPDEGKPQFWRTLTDAWKAFITARLREDVDAPVQTWTMRERTGELVR